MIKISTLCFMTLLFLFGTAWGQKSNFVERVFEGVSNNKNPAQARVEITNEATQKVSEDLMKEIIGESKYARNKSLIANKILKNSARYIPFSRPGELKPEGESFKMAVTLKINVEDLQGLLLENGLFYETDGTPVVIPLIKWNDRVSGKVFSWWLDGDDIGKAFLSRQNKNFETSLKQAFAKNQFYVMRPTQFKFQQLLVNAFRADHWGLEDLQNLGQKLGAQIALQGEVNISKSTERSEAQKIEIKVTATQVMNGRAIAEVSRQFETDPGAFEFSVDKKIKEVLDQATQDLAGQVFEAWARGAIGASLYRFTIRGRLPMLQQELLKETLKLKFREIKNLKERLISSDELVFELDSSLPPKDIAVKLPEFELPGFKFILKSSNEAELVYTVQPQKM